MITSTTTNSSLVMEELVNKMEHTNNFHREHISRSDIDIKFYYVLNDNINFRAHHRSYLTIQKLIAEHEWVLFDLILLFFFANIFLLVFAHYVMVLFLSHNLHNLYMQDIKTSIMIIYVVCLFNTRCLIVLFFAMLLDNLLNFNTLNIHPNKGR